MSFSLEWFEGAVYITGWQQIHRSTETGKCVWTARGRANTGIYSCLFPQEQMHRVDLIYCDISNILGKINGLLWHFCLSCILFWKARFEKLARLQWLGHLFLHGSRRREIGKGVSDTCWPEDVCPQWWN